MASVNGRDAVGAMADHVTSCPACRISFRVTDEQLAMAGGRVRCGSCLRVFNALDDLRELPAGSGTAAGSRNPAWAADEDDGEQPNFDEIMSELKEDELWIADLLREVEEVERHRGQAGAISAQPPPPTPGPAAAEPADTRRPPRQAGPQFWFEPDPDAGPDDDLSAYPGHEPEDDRVPRFGPRLEPGFQPGLEPDLEPGPEPVPEPDLAPEPRWGEPLAAIGRDDGFDDLAEPAEDNFQFGPIVDLEPEPRLHGEPQPVSGPEPESITGPGAIAPPAPWVVHPDDDEPEPAWDLEGDLREPELGAHEPDTGPRFGERDTDSRYDFDMEPLELRHRRAGRGWLTSLVSLLLIVAVVSATGWVAWDQRQQWSRVEAYRGAYEWLCRHVACGLQPAYDLSLIRSSQLVLRHHPDKPGLIAIDMMITNEADYAQSWPEFKVEFSDIDSNVLARERFSPRQYLRGDLAQGQLMASHQPVHIRLELKDPGNRAVSYQIELVRPPEPATAPTPAASRTQDISKPSSPL